MDIKNAIIKGFNKTKFTLVKYSPEILITTGVVTGVAATVLACKATLKVDSILEDSKDKLDAIHKVEADPEISEEEYSVADVKKDKTIVYVQTGLKIAKNYAPAVILGGVSITSVLAAYGIMKKRNAALALAYATAEGAFKKYRQKVVDKYGEAVDNEFRFGTGQKLKVEEVYVHENGEEVKEKKTVPVYKLDEYSDFAIDFRDCEASIGLTDYDLNTLSMEQKYLNDILHNVKDEVTLREVLDRLGYRFDPNDERSNRIKKQSMIVGWKNEKDNQFGENRILFKVIETAEEVNGEIRPYLIVDFNVDSKDIYSRM